MSQANSFVIGGRVVVRMDGEYLDRRGEVVLIEKDFGRSNYVDVVFDGIGNRAGERVSFDQSFVEMITN